MLFSNRLNAEAPSSDGINHQPSTIQTQIIITVDGMRNEQQ